MTLRRLTLFTGLMVFLSACQPPSSTTPSASAPAAKPSPPASVVPPAAATDEKPAIPTLVIDTLDGKKYDLAEHRGHWVVVNFWATWCNPCLKEMPDLDAFDQSHDDVDIIGLAYEDTERAEMAEFLKQHVVHYPIAMVDTFNPPADFETPRGLPMTYLIAPDGKVAKKFLGPVTSNDLAILIREAMATKSPPST